MPIETSNKDDRYINSVNYEDWKDKLIKLNDIIRDNATKLDAARKLRYAEVDVEAERESGRLQPDELFVAQHVINTNVTREQSPYIQYITQSPRAVICKDKMDKAFDMQLLDADLTDKLRYDGWQIPQFSNIDGFQQNGYSTMEVVMDQSNQGEVGHEVVEYGDFGFISDTKDIQRVEMCGRQYYFTKTDLLSLAKNPSDPDFDPEKHFNLDEVKKIVEREPEKNTIESSDAKDASLYRIIKVMFRIGGIVNVSWVLPNICSNWVRMPRKLYLGRRAPNPAFVQQQKLGMLQRGIQMITGRVTQQPQPQVPQSIEVYEKSYPYIIFPYLISENSMISSLKGRVFLDQDLQEAVSSLVSSTITQARRAAGLYGSKDTTDPNDDILEEKLITLKSGCVLNKKVSFTQLAAPDPSMFSAINMLMSLNQNETSQVNFAVNNRKDSRKTAKEISTAEMQQQQLSTVQVVLFAIALTQLYRLMVDIIVSRVLGGLIQVDPKIMPLYQRNFIVKPSGDVDVIEKQNLINKMMQGYATVAQTPAGPYFLMDLLSLMFPERADKYNQIIAQSLQQAQSVQAQQQQAMMQEAMQMAQGIVKLSEHPEFFSDTGRIHALPQVEFAADKIKNLQKQLTGGQKKGAVAA